MNMERPGMVMIVDDNPHNLKYLAEVVESNGYEAVMATSAQQALDFVAREKPDLILLDVMMPEMDGFEACRELKKISQSKDTPIIFITAQTDPEEIVKGFEAGGVDYVTKPFNGVVLNARMRTHMELARQRRQLRQYILVLEETNREIQLANAMVVEANSKLKEAIERAETLARKDYLTGIYNRLYMIERINDEIARFHRSNKHFGLIIGDIDNFKQFNDQYGHECGDQVLKAVARIMQDSIRAQDSLGRWGGEEFLLMLPETGVCGAAVTAEKIREAVASSVVACSAMNLSVTMTFGVYFYDGNMSIDEAINKADRALMEGKGKGKNAVVMAE